MAQDRTMDMAKANFYALGLMVPIVVIYLLIYAAIYGTIAMGNDLLAFFSNELVFLGSLVLGTVIHELLHAVSWSWLDGIAWNNIHFGFKWKSLTPYVHCPKPVEVNNYRWGVAMPGLILGVLPYLIALAFQIEWLYGFGLIFTLVAGGDMIMLWLLRDVEGGELVQDHPDLMGCKVLAADSAESRATSGRKDS